uniref:AlNc14C267G9912 protein n=1 Tax=Albugo laibachii Nc14 TaxID=890382 RepID=F0WU91_9STRA|nr:AlNc14C267G9912 [Albugo laibachii Nc14]|eukprot:CCA24969.1 AlNc14C267G9912 [Albugo laibachii Nc14]
MPTTFTDTTIKSSLFDANSADIRGRLYGKGSTTKEHGTISLSSNEIATIRRENVSKQRIQRLLQVRSHEKRMAAIVRNRYRQNISSILAEKQKTKTSEHSESFPNAISALQKHFESRKANIGQAQRQAYVLATLLQQRARQEKLKWDHNEEKVIKHRFQIAHQAKEAQKRATKESHALLIAKLATLDARCTHHRQMNHHKEELHKRMLQNLQKETDLDTKYPDEAQDCIITMERPARVNVNAFHFTRLHCKHENRFVSMEPTASVRVIRHHPSSSAWDTDTEALQAQIDAQKQAGKDTAAELRGQEAMQRLQGKLEDRQVNQWLNEWDKENRHRKLNAFEADAHGDRSIERAFEHAFGDHNVSEISLGIEGDHRVEPNRVSFDSTCLYESPPTVKCDVEYSIKPYQATSSTPSEPESRYCESLRLEASIAQYSLPSSHPPDSNSLADSLQQLDISVPSASTRSEASESLEDPLISPLIGASEDSISSSCIETGTPQLNLSSTSAQSPTQYSIEWLDMRHAPASFPSIDMSSSSKEYDTEPSDLDAVILARRRRRLMHLRNN